MNKLKLCEFIKFWSQFYNDPKNLDRKYYFPHIFPINRSLNPNDLEKLFEWKNGMPLSGNKKKALKLAIKRLDEINNFRRLDRISKKDIKLFFKFVSENIIRSGIVWRIFVLHIARPKELPMIDRFNFKAIEFLKTHKNKQINNSQSIEEYLQFKKTFNNLVVKSSQNYREVDKALMVFGQFLDNPSKILRCK
jgi:hypothetical protein